MTKNLVEPRFGKTIIISLITFFKNINKTYFCNEGEVE